MKNILNAEKVNNIFMDSLFKESECTDTAIIVEGITSKFGFNPQRIDLNKDVIYSMLLELPKEFRHSVGGGYSFLCACEDKNGVHWAEHPTMEKLFVLGIAIKKVVCLMPREMWKVLPGGVPYYMIEDN